MPGHEVEDVVVPVAQRLAQLAGVAASSQSTSTRADSRTFSAPRRPASARRRRRGLRSAGGLATTPRMRTCRRSGGPAGFVRRQVAHERRVPLVREERGAVGTGAPTGHRAARVRRRTTAAVAAHAGAPGGGCAGCGRSGRRSRRRGGRRRARPRSPPRRRRDARRCPGRRGLGHRPRGRARGPPARASRCPAASRTGPRRRPRRDRPR